MIQNTFWDNGRLVRRCYEVTGEKPGALAYGLTLTMIGLAVMLLSLGCGSADDSTPMELSPEPQHESSAEPEPVVEDHTPGVPAVTEEEMIALKATTPRTMYVWPDPMSADLVYLTVRVINRVHARTGASIEIREGGIPVTVRDGARQGSSQTDKWCFGGGCTAEHASIYISSATLARMYVDNFGDNSLAHEFVHVLSGWGKCSSEDVGGHLTPGHIVSNGNTGYGQMSWTDADTRLACSCGAC